MFAVSEGTCLFNKFIPTKIYANIYEITPEILLDAGIRGLILDIDNTLVTYDDPKPTESVRAWLFSMNNAGIQTAFVSNNHKERVSGFCEGLNCYYHADSGKPSRKYLREAMAHMGTDLDSTAAVGDQIFTDIYAAKRAGIRAFLVPPIKDKLTLFFRFKRLLEKPFLRAYKRKTKREPQNDKIL